MSHTYGASPEAWRHWALRLGVLGDLLPVVSNPGATISPDSKMQGLGKTPSEYNFRRQVRSFPGWTRRTTTQKEVERWLQEPDYGICVQTRDIRAIDIDVSNPRRAQRIVSHIERTLPWHLFPQRTRSDSGNTLLVFRLAGELTKRVIPVEGGMIEILGDGQQFVAVGTHPKGQRYEWLGGLPPAVPLLDYDDFDTLWETLCTAFLEEGKEPRIAREKRRISDMGDLPDVSDPVAEWLIANWDVHDSGPMGELYVRCPFDDEHTTDSGATSTAYFPAGTGGYEQGHWKCLHAHCEGRGDTLFLERCGYLEAQFEDLTGGEDETDVHDVGEAAGAAGGRDVVPGSELGSAAVPAKDRPWPRFTRDGKGAIEGTARNLKLAIEREDVVKRWLAYDAFRDEIVMGHWADPRDSVRWRAFKDEDYVDLRIQLEERGFKPFGREMLRDVVWRVAAGNRIDIAKEWLSRLEWDGVPRVDSFMVRYMRAEESDYAIAVARYLWTALAGRVMVPGIQADMAVILHGRQGARKTSAVRAMAPHEEMYTSVRLDDSDDDNARKLRGRTVVELEELRGLNSRHADEMKAWVSKRFEEWVPKYKEFGTKFPRRCVLLGTGNEHEILADSTGERRWLPITVGVGDEGLMRYIDVDGIVEDRLQLWAEGAAMFAEHGVLWEDAERLAVHEHHKFKIVDAWQPIIARWLDEKMFGSDVLNGDNPSGVNATQAAMEALQISARSVDRSVQMRVAKCLKALGYERRQERSHAGGSEGRQWAYFRV